MNRPTVRASSIVVPEPSTRIPATMYRDLRAWMLEHDPDAREMLEWSMCTAPPDTPEDLAHEVIWIILCAGRSAQAARTIATRVRAAMDAGRPAVEAFGYRAKAAAIDRAWAERQQDFDAYQVARATGDAQALLDWALSIPFIGDDTAYQLLKNFGSQVAKPDIWLCRMTGFPDKPRLPVKVRFPACMALCEMLASASGDSIAMIDSMLWLSANKGVLTVSAQAGPVSFTPRVITARPIM